MNSIRHWLASHRYEAHLVAFLLMIIPPGLLFLAARTGARGWIWLLLGLVVLGNLVAVAAR